MRLAVAEQQGLDEPTIDKVRRFEASDLDERHKVALRYADAIMTQPRLIDSDLRADLHRHFNEQQIIELTVDVMKWNYQKIPVALGTDVEVRPGELTPLMFDADGHWMRPN